MRIESSPLWVVGGPPCPRRRVAIIKVTSGGGCGRGVDQQQPEREGEKKKQRRGFDCGTSSRPVVDGFLLLPPPRRLEGMIIGVGGRGFVHASCLLRCVRAQLLTGSAGRLLPAALQGVISVRAVSCAWDLAITRTSA